MPFQLPLLQAVRIVAEYLHLTSWSMFGQGFQVELLPDMPNVGVLPPPAPTPDD